IALTDASLRNAQNNGADFRIGTTTGYNNYIREITVAIGTLDPASEPIPSTTGSAYSEFKDKAVAGYQVWFNTGTPTSGWFHWSGGAQPSVGHLNFEVYPDVREYNASDLTQTGFANLGDGTPSQLFQASDTGVINKHFDWLQSNGIDGVALQRFINGIGSVINNSPAASPLKVRAGAEATDRIFYVCYDISSTGLDSTWDDIIKFDWVYNIEQAYQLTSSPSYATVNNKPVVQIWGTGFTGNHPGTEQETIDLINFLKARGCYVIGGVPTYWRTETGDSKPSFLNAYKTYDMLSPWSVGRFGDVAGATNFKNNLLVPDKAFTDAQGIDYMPVLFPGFSWSQWNSGLPNAIPRQAGDFSWNQALNIKSIGVQNMYFAMMDEYDEGTAIMKAATDYFMIPTDQYFVTTSADGIWTSSDFYLRLAGAEIELLKGTRSVTSTVPIAYSEGPIYYRNSFEKRLANYNTGSGSTSGSFNIDACFYHDAVLSNTGITGGSVSIVNESSNTKSGIYSVKATGTTSSGTASNYYYQVSETKIGVKANMQLSFWKYSVDALGQYTSVDLVFQSGKRLSTLAGYVDNKGYAMSPTVARGPIGVWEQFTCQIGVGELIGDELIGIVIGYDHPSVSGSYNAYFDDIIIEDAQAVTRVETPYLGSAFPIPGKIEAEYYDYGGEGLAYNDSDEENKFNLYRVDEGVDIESTGDVGGGYDVGWIETGEWMNYMVNVTTTGQYTLEVRVASGNVGTKSMHVEMDGVDISGLITFSVSSGWQSYQTISVTTPVLTAGAKVMRVYIDGGGFNLNYVNYSLLVATGVTESEGMSAVTVYPNPVKGGSSITIQQTNQEAGMSQIRLYNYLGQVVLETTGDTSSNVLLPLPQQLSSGYYQLEVTGQSGKSTMQKLLIY
ncbi:MAG TPA: carbohydrate-binding protein, partial [Cytophagaceae bacterium]|nr:carbohydrate-binding protein [Cytophagaceae bacterium]